MCDLMHLYTSLHVDSDPFRPERHGRIVQYTGTSCRNSGVLRTVWSFLWLPSFGHRQGCGPNSLYIWHFPPAGFMRALLIVTIYLFPS